MDQFAAGEPREIDLPRLHDACLEGAGSRQAPRLDGQLRSCRQSDRQRDTNARRRDIVNDALPPVWDAGLGVEHETPLQDGIAWRGPLFDIADRRLTGGNSRASGHEHLAAKGKARGTSKSTRRTALLSRPDGSGDPSYRGIQLLPVA